MKTSSQIQKEKERKSRRMLKEILNFLRRRAEACLRGEEAKFPGGWGEDDFYCLLHANDLAHCSVDYYLFLEQLAEAVKLLNVELKNAGHNYWAVAPDPHGDLHVVTLRSAKIS